jgi:hypothetical protein
MRTVIMIGAAALLAAIAVPAMADDAMKPAMDAMGGQMTMLKAGETVAIMPDGHMGTAMVTDKMDADHMMKMAKPLDHCMMIMMGHDGKMYSVDTMGHEGMTSCEKMAK